jgi:hypothetical protein
MRTSRTDRGTLAALLLAHGVFDADGRAAALTVEVRDRAKGRTPREVTEAARIAIDQLDRQGRSAGDITPGLILAALGGRHEAQSSVPAESCLGCDAGVVRLMDWKDGNVVAFACDCPAGRERTPPLTPALQAQQGGRYADADPVRLACWDFTRGRTDEHSRRHVVEDLYGVLRHYRLAAVKAAMREVPAGQWADDFPTRAQAHQQRLDAMRTA